MIKFHFSFKPGMNELKVSDIQKVSEEIRKLISMKGEVATIETFRRRAYDWPNIPVPMKEGIDKIFRKYKVPKEKVWKTWQTQ